MAAATSFLLTDPHPCRHIVYPYTDEMKAINAVFLFASSGLSKGESVILVMVDSRRKPISDRLTDAGFDPAALQISGQLEYVSADSMLQMFMQSGALDETLVKDSIGAVITRAKASSPARKVRVFGEMVSILLSQDQISTALRLEEVWNEIIGAHSISLLCTYALVNSLSLPEPLVNVHSHFISL